MNKCIASVYDGYEHWKCGEKTWKESKYCIVHLTSEIEHLRINIEKAEKSLLALKKNLETLMKDYPKEE